MKPPSAIRSIEVRHGRFLVESAPSPLDAEFPFRKAGPRKTAPPVRVEPDERCVEGWNADRSDRTDQASKVSSPSETASNDSISSRKGPAFLS
ncbi:MAG: hypothetical protein CMJ52_00295 [Planctomycetaceae bacterium]|nr:hypothetical protein [Planctomycetaceae bacterium]